MRSIPEHPLKIWRQAQIPPLSQRAAAALLKTSDMTIGRWEKGADPLFDAWLQITRVTGLTPNDFHEHRAILARRKLQESTQNGRKTETSRRRQKAAKGEKGESVR
jgi:hypothetical protein